jgi:hypothetical protein
MVDPAYRVDEIGAGAVIGPRLILFSHMAAECLCLIRTPYGWQQALSCAPRFVSLKRDYEDTTPA